MSPSALVLSGERSWHGACYDDPPMMGGARSTMAGVETLDAFARDVAGDVELTIEPQAPTGAPLTMPERRLAMELVKGALFDAERRVNRESQSRYARRIRLQRWSARAWLKDDGVPLSARACIEALGMDYDEVKRRLLDRWGRIDRGCKLPPIKLGGHVVGRYVK